MWPALGSHAPRALESPPPRPLPPRPAPPHPTPPTPPPAAKRAVLGSGLASGDNLWAHTLSSLCSGLVASAVSTPADVVKTRVMTQDPQHPIYSGSIDCFLKTLRAEGWRGLYKGWGGTLDFV